MIREEIAQSLLGIVAAIGRTENLTETREARAKHGESLIRVDWKYADVASKRPELQHVCTWPDGDEGYVFTTQIPQAPIRYFFDQDSSSHWFMVPESIRETWEAWRYLDDSLQEAWTPPDGAIPLGSYPNGISFENPSNLSA